MYYFASDLHLGLSTGSDTRDRERLFVQWLDEVAPTAEAIFLVGDMFDFWFEYRQVVPRGYTRLLGKLSELTDRGVEIHLLVGNHDLWAFDYLQRECGLRIHPTPYLEFQLAGRRVVVGHGDVLGPQPLINRTLSSIFRSRVAQCLFYLFHPDLSLAAGNYWSRSNRKAKQIKHTFRGEGERVVEFAREYLDEKGPVDYFVFGHLHCATIYPLTDSCEVVVLGEWMVEPTYGVLTESGFELKSYPGLPLLGEQST